MGASREESVLKTSIFRRAPRIALCCLSASEHTGGAHMQGRIFAGLFLCSLFIVVGGDAQSPAVADRPVWTMEFIKVKPDNFGLTLGYLDDQWMRIREEAKRQGEILSY